MTGKLWDSFYHQVHSSVSAAWVIPYADILLKGDIVFINKRRKRYEEKSFRYSYGIDFNGWKRDSSYGRNCLL